ncbi:Asp-tRNA(Asn)/Glu-tRNA(Gln) amidotransferase A subunit family amidase [Actinomycetospora succinea]|uniref:Asp-tRNA(Asn)/Glu-tRNA(Gln) amidotransferase A subunit family amidase n=1 Tax=Actinomycetospora succinea TaxID=663603 RepID=A0A4R6VMS3_9PSEU|nr:amidase [Actinomycetospora succinea]TDQ63251.1 Asp-tRNA(Asn)/Glu-tRNA(Gln) amidotransferase A subunit family amidase [Actinomycetospora succinea]
MDSPELVDPWRLADTRGAEAARRRIAAIDDRVRAWVTLLDADEPGTGPLAGVPVGVKDIIDVAGVPTRCGSPVRADTPPAAADAAIVRLLREAGAVVVGKTVTTEFACFDPGPTRNPHDLARTPGGSSSGSAAAVAAGMVPLALGSQTAGSVVRPSSFCGVAGLAVARGALPTDGVNPLAPSLDTLGLFAATVEDLALARAALTGREPAGATVPRLLAWDGTEIADVSPAMRAAHADAVERARAAGADVGAWDVDLRAAAADHHTVMAAEASEVVPSDPRLGERLTAMLDEGRAVSPDVLAGARSRAAATRTAALARLETADAVLVPGALGVAPLATDGTGDPVMSRPWHLLGLPALAVPGARDEAGLPLGLALIGHPDREDALLSAGRWLEARV